MFLERQNIKTLANLYFCGLFCEVIKHNKYNVMDKLKLNMDKKVKIDTAQRLERLPLAFFSARAC